LGLRASRALRALVFKVRVVLRATPAFKARKVRELKARRVLRVPTRRHRARRGLRVMAIRVRRALRVLALMVPRGRRVLKGFRGQRVTVSRVLREMLVPRDIREWSVPGLKVFRARTERVFKGWLALREARG